MTRANSPSGQGSACLDLAAEVLDKTDCLVLDVQLPGKSRLELQAESIKAKKTCPTVFISSFQDESIRTRAIENGANDFLGKPLNIDRLLEIVDAAISNSNSNSTAWALVKTTGKFDDRKIKFAIYYLPVAKFSCRSLPSASGIQVNSQSSAASTFTTS